MRVLVTGGAGYVGAVLVPSLLANDHDVTVLDTFWYGRDVLPPHERLRVVEGDIRDVRAVQDAVRDCSEVIHLACVSNDPSFELDPRLGESINFGCFETLVRTCKTSGVQRFVYASSSSVYGVSDAPDVTEEHPLHPLTDYSRLKAKCEPILLGERSPDFLPVVVRPATVCGYSPRQRLDVIVNILTNHAVNTRRLRVFGGSQLRPNIHIRDMVACYELLLSASADLVSGKTFNAGYHNHTVSELAETVRRVVERERPELAPIAVAMEPTDDPRSYHVNSEKIARELGFVPTRTIDEAVVELVHAFNRGALPDSMNDPKYLNVKVMRALADRGGS